jgi:hypothetical protein
MKKIDQNEQANTLLHSKKSWPLAEAEKIYDTNTIINLIISGVFEN